jgi:hypothetical protein
MYVIVLHPLDVLRSVIVNQDLQDPEDKMVRDDEHRVGAHGWWQVMQQDVGKVQGVGVLLRNATRCVTSLRTCIARIALHCVYVRIRVCITCNRTHYARALHVMHNATMSCVVCNCLASSWRHVIRRRQPGSPGSWRQDRWSWSPKTRYSIERSMGMELCWYVVCNVARTRCCTTTKVLACVCMHIWYTIVYHACTLRASEVMHYVMQRVASCASCGDVCCIVRIILSSRDHKTTSSIVMMQVHHLLRPSTLTRCYTTYSRRCCNTILRIVYMHMYSIPYTRYTHMHCVVLRVV